MIYHLSKDPNIRIMTPRVPHFLANGLEDETTPRICFSTSINGCLNALEVHLPFNKYYFEDTNEICKFKNDTFEMNKHWESMIKNCEDKFLYTSLENIESLNLDSYSRTGDFAFPLFYVYVPKEYVEYTPATSAFDYEFTDEVWVTKEIEVKKIGAIIVTDCEYHGKMKNVVTEYGEDCGTIIRKMYNFIKLPPNYSPQIMVNMNSISSETKHTRDKYDNDEMYIIV